MEKDVSFSSNIEFKKVEEGSKYLIDLWKNGVKGDYLKNEFENLMSGRGAEVVGLGQFLIDSADHLLYLFRTLQYQISNESKNTKGIRESSGENLTSSVIQHVTTRLNTIMPDLKFQLTAHGQSLLTQFGDISEEKLSEFIDFLEKVYSCMSDVVFEYSGIEI